MKTEDIRKMAQALLQVVNEQKPDFLDLDKDGNKKEPMKKAAADAKAKKKSKSEEDEENLDEKRNIKVTKGDKERMVNKQELGTYKQMGWKEVKEEVELDEEVSPEVMKMVQKYMDSSDVARLKRYAADTRGLRPDEQRDKAKIIAVARARAKAAGMREEVDLDEISPGLAKKAFDARAKRIAKDRATGQAYDKVADRSKGSKEKKTELRRTAYYYDKKANSQIDKLNRSGNKAKMSSDDQIKRYDKATDTRSPTAKYRDYRQGGGKLSYDDYKTRYLKNSFDPMKEEVDLDEANMQRAAKELEMYARKSGGIDKEDFKTAVLLMKKGKTKELNDFVRTLDTDPRDKILDIMQKNEDLDEAPQPKWKVKIGKKTYVVSARNTAEANRKASVIARKERNFGVSQGSIDKVEEDKDQSETNEAMKPTAQHKPDDETRDTYDKQLSTRKGEKDFKDKHKSEVAKDVDKENEINFKTFKDMVKKKDSTRSADAKIGDKEPIKNNGK